MVQLVLTDGIPFMWKECYKCGLKYAHQLYENGRVISAATAERKFSLSIMRFNTLITAIPVQWKKLLRDGHIGGLHKYGPG